MSGPLSGLRIVVAGAGLAGLAAARDLESHGAQVTVVEARERVGGRVHTIRDGFSGAQHAEGGADLIEGGQTHVHALARELDLHPVRILQRGWGFYGINRRGLRSVRRAPDAFEEAARRLQRELEAFTLSECRWDSGVAAGLARISVADWLASGDRDPAFAASMRGLRGFFLADPEDLSLLVLVEQFASDDTPGEGPLYRLREGNDALPRAIASRLRTPVLLGRAVRRIRQDARGVRVTVEERGVVAELEANYCIVSLPASTLRDVAIEPPLPEPQHDAIARLRYGCATRMLLQFSRRFWRRAARPSAFGTDLPIGAVWDANERQPGEAGILALLAGGHASRDLRDVLQTGGEGEVVRQLSWMGKPAPLLAARTITWEDEPWSRGGYAYFDPGFDPAWRAWLARPAVRLLFAGEHTSNRWQGYMNGAIETGKRAAAEVLALAGTLGRQRR